MVCRFAILVGMVGLSACTTAQAQPTPVPATPPPPPAVMSAALPAAAPATELVPTSAYAWGPKAPASDRLNNRFAAPAGFTRVDAPADSLGRWLRALPLQPAGSPVLSFNGSTIYGSHPNISAVADLDIGTKDLQHCADVILRLHAEWRYGKGERDLSYRSVSGQTMSYKSWMAGERAVIEGKGIVFKHVAAPAKDTHSLMRGWMDEVFSWAGTASLERDAKKVDFKDIAPGDFFVMSGQPFGHAVLVLDVAKDDKGRLALLLGQSYMPAQSFQILRHDPANDWFIVDVNDIAVATPFWQPFLKTSLRRL